MNHLESRDYDSSHDGRLSGTALQYLNSASKWALFFAIVSVLVMLFDLFYIEGVSDVIGIVVGIVVAFFAWKYASNAKQTQSNADMTSLAQTTASLNTILIIMGVITIIALVLLCIGALFAVLAAL